MKNSMNIKEVAKLAGVSVASVSRALQSTPSPYISEKQRQRIRRICEELHYFPDVHTKRMFSKKSNNIALFSRYHDIISFRNKQEYLDYNFGAVMIGAQSVFAAKEISLQLIDLSESFLQSKQYLKLIRSKMFDGAMLWGALSGDGDYIRDILNEELPFVMLFTKVDGFDVCSVTADDYSGMRNVVEQVIAAGHRKIAVLEPGPLASVGYLRAKAIRDVLAEHEITPVWVSPESGFNYEFGQRMTVRMLSEAVDVTAVIASNDMTAWGCIEEFGRRGIRVPDDISVSGADGISMPGPIQIASFHLPSFRIGVRGAELLYNMMKRQEKMVSEVLPVTQVEGNTITKVKRRGWGNEKKIYTDRAPDGCCSSNTK